MTRRSLLLTAVVVSGCGRSAPPPPAVAQPTVPFRFTDVTAQCGLDMTTTFGVDPATKILEVKGGGVGLIDFDDDGDLDVFVCNGATMDDPERGPGSKLFENLGDMRFRDATERAGIALARWAIGVTVADYDGDGLDDIYVTCFGPNVLLRNTGGVFEDVSAATGTDDPRWSTAAAFGDLDGDGDLDLYVCNYVEFDVDDPPPDSTFRGHTIPAGPKGLTPSPDALYENLGDGTFRDASAGVAAPPAYGLGVAIVPFDDEPGLDLYVGNDSMPSYLFVGTSDPLVFDERGLARGIATSGGGVEQATMGIAIGDVDGDERPDVFTTNFAQDVNTLHVNSSSGHFDDDTRKYGLGMVSIASLGWACALVDLDHDADQDLVVFNGHVYAGATRATMGADYAQPPLVFERVENRFEKVTREACGPWLAAAHCDRGAAFGDLDGDGDVDIVVSEHNGPVRVLRNDGAGPGWITIAPEMPEGCRVEITLDGRTHVQWIPGGGGFVSASDRVAHLGIPAGTSRVDVGILWPDGSSTHLTDVEINRRHRLGKDS